MTRQELGANSRSQCSGGASSFRLTSIVLTTYLLDSIEDSECADYIDSRPEGQRPFSGWKVELTLFRGVPIGLSVSGLRPPAAGGTREQRAESERAAGAPSREQRGRDNE